MKNYRTLTLIVVIFFTFWISTVSAQERGFAPSDGVDIHYTIIGEGKPLLLINGGPGYSSHHFEAIGKQISDSTQRRIILFDQRGTGKSELETIDSTTVNMELMVKDIEVIRNHLGIDNWDVMGHSFGGILAMFYAAEYPTRISKLILSASGGIDASFVGYVTPNVRMRLSDHNREKLDHWSDPDNIADPVEALNKRTEAFAEATVYDKSHVPDIVEALTVPGAYQNQINGLVWRDLLGKNYDLKPELQNFDKSTLIIQGRQDYVGDATAFRIHMTLPDSELFFINRSGHYMWLDRPEVYFNKLDTFLNIL
jgi:proline iminopeptidase